MLATFGLFTLGAGGCTEDPSYQLSWRLTDDAQVFAGSGSAPALTAVSQCSEVGIAKLEVTTLAADGSIADISRYPCFPSVFAEGGAADGPTLAPGTYTLEIEGLRRTDEPWVCEPDPDLPDAGPCVAQAQASVVVVEGRLPEVDFLMLSPPQCDDGIDNDDDGRVDEKDPACLIDPTSREDSDLGAVVFQLSTTFLDSRAVAPSDVGVRTLVVDVDGDEVLRIKTNSLDPAIWPYRLPAFSERYETGEHLLEITGLDSDDQPLTEALAVPFAANDAQSGFVLQQFDFLDTDFVEPIVEPFSIVVSLLAYPGASSFTSNCELGDGTAVTSARMRVFDEDQSVLDPAGLGLSVEATVEADGWVSIACPAASIESAPLTWGAYSIEIEALVDDAVCFDSAYDVSVGPLLDPVEAAPLAPKGTGGAQNIVVARVLDDEGRPPPGCEECTVDENCDSGECSNGLCKD